MNPLSQQSMSRVVGELVVGTNDVSAREQGAALCGRADTIKGLRVLNGTGVLVCVDDVTGKTFTIGNVVALQANDEITPEWGLKIRSINGTSNAAPSGALSLRCVW